MADNEDGSRPIPDPTVLTTAQLYREIGAVKFEHDKDIVHLREAMDAADRLYSERFAAQRDAIGAAFESTKAAVDKAEIATNQRFDTVERERKILTEHTNECLPRSEYDNRHQAINDKIDGAYMTLTDKINSVQSTVDQMQATIRGQRQLGNLIFALIAAAGVVVAIIAGVVAVLKP